MVVKMLNTNAQIRLYPYETPAIEQVMTVPGPMKAAETRVPGPRNIFFLGLFNGKVCEFSLKNIFDRLNLVEIIINKK
jgi:hypothetical protein